MKAPSTKLSSCSWHKHVAAYCQTEVRPASDLNYRIADVFFKISWAGATDTVKSSGCHLELDPLRHRQPVKGIAKNRPYAFELTGTDDRTIAFSYFQYIGNG